MVPEYPLNREEQIERAGQIQGDAPEAEAQTDAARAGVELPSEVTFAQEVRAERLGILWKITLSVAIILWWALIVISGGRDIDLVGLLAPTGVLAVGCILTAEFLRREQFQAGVWSYALGAIVAIGLALTTDSTFGQSYAPFIFPVLLFVVGLLLPVRDTLTMMLIVFALAVGVPSLDKGDLMLSETTFFALLLTAIATGLSAQVSGELYAIAEWALENYRKERQTTFALFESRQELEKSLLRQQALTYEVQQANTALEEARRAEEEAKNFRGQFLANMSHELRTPLNAIIGFSQTMLDFPAMYDGMELPYQYRQDMNQILSSGKVLLNIINDILDLSKVDAGKLDLEIQPVDLEPIVKGVLSTAVGLVGDKGPQIDLQRRLPDPLPIVMGDPLRVRQVLLNLFSNAAKFTDAGYIRLSVKAEDGRVIFAVEDTGIGIADTDKATIFEEFRQGTAGRKKGRQGAGLGLAISQQLLRLMGGRLWFDSVLGKGSTFYFSLPQHIPEKTETSDAPPVKEEKAAPATTPPATTDAAAGQSAAPESPKIAPASVTDTSK
jgi:signal transduction histidine kinase